MIKKDSYLLNTYAGLRVKEIGAKTDTYAWRHINSKENYVSDILTREETPNRLGEGSQWQRGPSWLTEEENTWPVTSPDLVKTEREQLRSFEKISQTNKAVMTTIDQEDPLTKILLKNSSLIK